MFHSTLAKTACGLSTYSASIILQPSDSKVIDLAFQTVKREPHKRRGI